MHERCASRVRHKIEHPPTTLSAQYSYTKACTTIRGSGSSLDGRDVGSYQAYQP